MRLSPTGIAFAFIASAVSEAYQLDKHLKPVWYRAYAIFVIDLERQDSNQRYEATVDKHEHQEERQVRNWRGTFRHIVA